MSTPEFERTVAFRFRGQLHYARKAKGETIINAVVRSIDRRIQGPVTMWWSESRDGHDVYTAKWYDPSDETFQECEVIL